MKVKKLIKQLKKLDSGSRVFLFVQTDSGFYDLPASGIEAECAEIDVCGGDSLLIGYKR